MTNSFGPLRGDLRALFENALDVPPLDRAQWLESQCADCADRLILDRLLAADAGDASPIVDGSFDTLFGASAGPPPGTQIGSFTLGEKLGEGGSSVVFVAHRELTGVVQRVALKLLRRNLYTQDEQRRFRDERRALSQLEHPGIARLIEGGVTEAGTPYIALELVEGESILDHARSHALDIPARLHLFIAVCRAVEAAHRALIVHRDIKPSNILVTTDGTVKVVDFGVAKMLGDDLTDATGAGYSPLTPSYAAPEQFSGGVISTATDVYALGVLLHELLLGQRPLRDENRYSHTTRRVLARDLQAIIGKALADEPARRYAGASELAEDVEFFLAGRPVHAHPPSAAYRARKFLTRHRVSVSMASFLVVVLLASFATALWQASIARTQAEHAAHEAQRADSVRDFLEGLFEPISDGIAERKVPSVKDLVGIGVGKVESDTDLAPAEHVDLLTMFARLSANLGDDARARELATKADALATRSLPRIHPAAIDARVLLASQALNREDYVHAEEILRDALVRVSAGGGVDRAAIEIKDQLAVIETKHNHREQALALVRSALDERVRLDGPDAKSLAGGYANVAACLTNLGRFEEAAEAFGRAAKNDRINRAAGSYDVLSTLSNWGAALQVAGHIGAALNKFREADQGFAELGGKTRRMHAVNLQKLCVTEASFASPAVAAETCARSLQVTRAVAGDASKLMAIAKRTEAWRLIEAGDLDDAALRLNESWSGFPDTPQNQEGRAVIRYVRASLDWARGDAASARGDARWAIDHISGLAILWGARVSARTTLLLACADGPHPECGSSPRKDLEVAIAEVRNSDDPRLLLARVAVARQDMDRDPAAAARALKQAIASARVELADDHPWLRAAKTWRALALDHVGDCTAAKDMQSAYAPAGSQNPWLAEATQAYLRAKKCLD